jgi:uncharacterized Fe-S cluster protein YjdI/CDGSH-type Zn-finger protein
VKRLQVYQSHEITVTYDPNICVHAGTCVRGLPAVFDTSRADWIHPDAAPAEEVAALVARCPSGALQAIRPGIAPVRPVDSPGTVTVRIVADGPAQIRGPVHLEFPSGAESDRTSFAICRCGNTQEPPFCDGSHQRARFRSRP